MLSMFVILCVSAPVQGQYLAVGTNSGYVQIWDPAVMKHLSTLNGHSGRIGQWRPATQESNSYMYMSLSLSLSLSLSMMYAPSRFPVMERRQFVQW